jgi:A/G-specific adenine glycosylase
VEAVAPDSVLQAKITGFIEGILEWYEHNKRDYLFWRNTKDPYYILVSEMMLQKTTVKQVQNLIKRFLDRFPTPKALANASVEEIRELITPLGMEHKRAVRYKKWAEIVVEKYGGQIPDSEKELLSLPGVGQYMANGVLCLAFGKDVPLVDTNIVRILERVFDFKSDKARARTDKKFWGFVRRITPPGKSRDVNLALLDHGALVCTAKNPKCLVCPIYEICATYKEGKG